MPSKSLQKVQKHVSKKQNGKKKALHENSRDARRIRQASRRQDRLAALLQSSNKSRQPYIDRVFYFQTLFVGDDDEEPGLAASEALSPTQLQEAMRSFLARHDEDISALESERRPGRPPSNRETALKQRKAADQAEFSSGLWAPDLRDPVNIRALQKWSGDWSAMGQLSFVRIASDGAVTPASFPPNKSS